MKVKKQKKIPTSFKSEVKKLRPYTKMDKKTIKLDDTEIEEYKFPQNKIPISANDIDINKTIASNKLPFCKKDFKYFIGYKYSEKDRFKF